MAATRRDNRGIVLEKGESQDKSGILNRHMMYIPGD